MSEITRKDMEDSGATKRGLISKLLKGLASAIIKRADMEAYWKDNNTVSFTINFTGDFTGEIKGTLNWTGGNKGVL